MSDIAPKIAFILERLPIAIALLDATGKVVGKSGQLSGILGDSIPSRDPTTRSRWSFADRSGGIIAPTDWPSARALRGEHIRGGMIGVYENEGRHIIKVTSVPASGMADEVAVITFLQKTDRETRSAEGSYSDLEYRIIEALMRSLSNDRN